MYLDIFAYFVTVGNACASVQKKKWGNKSCGTLVLTVPQVVSVPALGTEKLHVIAGIEAIM